MRTPAIGHTPPVLKHPPVPDILADLTLRVVTPMFGGGVETGVFEVDNLIRPAAIRGHLRFWWRACNAARFTSLDDLHAEERALWGSAAKKGDPTYGPGAIAIRVLDVRRGRRFTHQAIPDPPRDPKDGWRKENDMTRNELGPDYALFPFTPQTDPPRGALDGMVGITFRLQVTVARHAGKGVELPGKRKCVLWPGAQQCKQAAEQALWAWIVFGGVGARTRRGCGTLLCTGNGGGAGAQIGEYQLDAGCFIPSGNPLTWLEQAIARHAKGSLPSCVSSVPMLTGCQVAIRPGVANAQPTLPIPAWKTAAETMQNFLQGKEIGRNRGNGNRPGQSRWPEAGAARSLLPNVPGGIDSDGKAYKVTVGASGKDFPRADLGMPRRLERLAAPVPTIKGAREGTERLASPIVLKALPLSPDVAIPIALALVAPHVWDPSTPGVVLEQGNTRVPLAVGPLDVRAPGWPWSDIPPHVADPGVKSARDAFMNFVASRNGWRKIR